MPQVADLIEPASGRNEGPKKLDWSLLLSRINIQKCTPILGPCTYAEFYPLLAEMAHEWVQDDPNDPDDAPELKVQFPFGECNEIGLAAQFLTVKYDEAEPKYRFIEYFKKLAPPDLDDPDEPHRVLAALPLPVYITTNYDDFMTQALKRVNRAPRRDFSHWNKSVTNEPSVFDPESDYKPDVPNPVVFHLHGYNENSDSLVLSDDDYLDFLVNISKNEKLIPAHIQKALTGSMLLLLGFRLDDWNFRVMFRSIISFLDQSIIKTHVAVQLVPTHAEASEEEKERAKRYFDRYFKRRDVHVYWGTCQEFAADLRENWEIFLKKQREMLKKQREAQQGHEQ